MREDVSPAALRRAGDLLARFLADRGDRTLQAYTADVDDFARFVGTGAAAAIALLLVEPPAAARRMILDYVVDLRQRGRAQATIDRRLSTLRALTRGARQAGIVTWSLEVPDDADVAW